jgi:hypothetical protein
LSNCILGIHSQGSGIDAFAPKTSRLLLGGQFAFVIANADEMGNGQKKQ